MPLLLRGQLGFGDLPEFSFVLGDGVRHGAKVAVLRGSLGERGVDPGADR
jgi:hypothetical protein